MPIPSESVEPKSITAAQYKELKRRAFRFEQQNNDSIVVFPAKGDGTWYRMGGTSALIYLERVVRPLHLSATMRDDTDYNYVFELGMVTIRDVQLLERRIERAKVLDRVMRGGGTVRFKLNFSLTKVQIQELENQEILRRNNLAKIIEPTFSNPELYVEIAHITKRVTEMASKRQDHFAQSVYGRGIVKAAEAWFREYLLMTSEPDGNSIERWQKLRDMTVDLVLRLQIIGELKLWPPDKTAVVARSVLKAKTAIETEIEQREKVKTA